MSETSKDWLSGTLVVIVIAIVCIGLVFGGVAGCGAFKGWQRGQARANAHNQVLLTQIQAQNQAQYATVIRAHNAVVKQQAFQRFLESVGIRRAQDEISRTLTPLYIQHEAIQALDHVATSGQNNTVVYVPSGQNGVPLVTAQAGKGK